MGHNLLMPIRICVLVLLVFGGMSSFAPAFAANWTQFGFDQQHSGNNIAEKGFSTPGNRKLYQVQIGVSDVQPVFLNGVATATGARDLLFVVLLDGTIQAIDATDGSIVWSNATSGNSPSVQSGAAIDPDLQFVYAVGRDGKVHKYAVSDGVEILDANWPEISSLKPNVENPTSALSIATDATNTSYLYAVVAGYSDWGDYQGHITAINLQTGAQTVFNTQCSNLMMHFVENGNPRVDDCDLLGPNRNMVDGQMSGIWGRPGVVYSEQMDRIYAATGNALFDANHSGGFEWGDTLLALHPDGTGSGMGWPLDSYTPVSYTDMYYGNNDLGSTSPAILPSRSRTYPHLAIQGSKDGCIRLINLDDMSGVGGPGNIGGGLPPDPSACSGPEIFGQPVVWVDRRDGNTWAFVPQHFGLLVGFRLVTDVDIVATPTLAKQWTSPDLVRSSPVMANGTLYYEGTNSSEYYLEAADPISGARIWRSDANIGAHWQSPVVVNSHIYFIASDPYLGGSSSILYAYLLDGIFRDGFQN